VGTVGLAFDFDAQDAAPTSQMAALSYHDKSADSPWKDQCTTLDLVQGDRLPIRYTRAGTPGLVYDVKTYDIGNLHVFVDGVAASTNLGLLGVRYVIDLYTPQIQDPVGGLFYSNAGLDATHLFGTNFGNPIDAQAIGVGTVNSTGQIFTFNQTWSGLVAISIVGTVLSADYAPVVSASGSAQVISQVVNAGATNVVVIMRVRAVPGTTLTPTITATTVTYQSWLMATTGYTQLGA
jgi:hypothetical protein